MKSSHRPIPFHEYSLLFSGFSLLFPISGEDKKTGKDFPLPV
jgi:hypothetical protein